MLAKYLGLALFCAQAQTPQPAFEAASVKPATPLGPLGMRADRKGGPGTADPGMYSCRNCPLSWVLDEAFDLQPFQYAGPEWVNETRFDFMAKIPPAATKETFRAMLQNLLVERFHLAVHNENRPMQIYELTVARGGPKFHESSAKEALAEGGDPGPLKRDKDGFPVLSGGASMAIVPGHAGIRSVHQPIAWFARILSGQLQTPVIDATGLKGNYDFEVYWAFENGGADAMLEPFRPAMIAAVQSQLGLKLESKKGQAQVLVVDRLDRAPTEN